MDPSPWRERFHFAGWAPLEAVKNYYADANVALSVDADTVEARLGHRNRVTEWVMAGTPVLSTALSEITRALAQADAMAVFAPGDAGGLTAALLDVVDHPDRAGERAGRARQVVAAMFDPSITLAPLRRWVEDPVCANDLPPLGDRSGFGLFGTARPCYGVPGPWLAGLADDPVRSRLDWRRWPVLCSIGRGIVRVRRWWRGRTGQKRDAGPYSG